MRLLVLVALIVGAAVSSAWGAVAFIKLTPANINTLPFEFRFDRSDFWADPIITVRVRPKTETLDQIRDIIGGRLDPCPARSDGHDFLPMSGAYSEEAAGTLIFRFIVPKT